MVKKTTRGELPLPGIAVYVVYQQRPGYWRARTATLIKWSNSGGNTGNVKVRLDDGVIARFHQVHVKLDAGDAWELAESLSARAVHVGSAPGGTTSLLVA